jgi:hypothetical protein
LSPPDTGPDRDLEQIERALAEGRVSAAAGRDRELQELALALRAEALEPEARFSRELDDRVAAGFPRSRRLRRASPRLWVPAAAVVGAVAAAAAIAVTSAGPDASSPSAGGPGPGAVAPSRGRRVERSARLTLAAGSNRIASLAGGVEAAARSHGGVVTSSTVTGGHQGAAGGSLELRVPSDRLDATLADLARLGRVSSRTESGRDMTEPFGSIENRLGVAVAGRTAIAGELRHSRGARATALRDRLRAASRQVNALSAGMNDLRRRTGFATIAVTLGP